PFPLHAAFPIPYRMLFQVGGRLGNRQRGNQDGRNCCTTASPFNKSIARASTGSFTTGFGGSISLSGTDVNSSSIDCPVRNIFTSSASLIRRRAGRFVTVKLATFGTVTEPSATRTILGKTLYASSK